MGDHYGPGYGWPKLKPQEKPKREQKTARCVLTSAHKAHTGIGMDNAWCPGLSEWIHPEVT